MLEKNKRIIATVILFILVSFTLILTYLKFFPTNNVEIEEIPVNDSSSKAIHLALQEITANFNQNSKLKEYAETNNINIKASVNNYSIYISYIADTTTTYEFTYDNLCLNIIIEDTEQNKEKFNLVYRILIEAIQTRINNNNEYNVIIDNFLNNESINYEGLTKEKVNNSLKYTIDITKKLNSRTEE